MPRTRTYGLDIDTIRYAQRVKSGSGITILPEPLKQINKFVVGVKKMKLWDLVANIFLLSSNQNAGVKTTLYGLKPNNDGTFRTSENTRVEWSINGVNFYCVPNFAGDAYIACPPLQVYNGNITFFGIGKGNGTDQAVYFGTQSNRSDGNRAMRLWVDAYYSSTEITYSNAQDASTNAQVKAGGFNSVSYTVYYDSATTNGYLKVYKNGNLVTTTPTVAMTLPVYDPSTIYPGPDELKLGGYAYQSDTKLHFFGAFYKTLSDQEHKDLNNLIKRTVGTGLALP